MKRIQGWTWTGRGMSCNACGAYFPTHNALVRAGHDHGERCHRRQAMTREEREAEQRAVDDAKRKAAARREDRP